MSKLMILGGANVYSKLVEATKKNYLYACKDKKRFWLYPIAILLHTALIFIQYLRGQPGCLLS